MFRKKCLFGGTLLLLLVIILGACKKNPTTATINLGENAILAACSPASGGLDAMIAVAVLIAENSEQVRVFGLEMSFDPQVFQYQEVVSGNLTDSWTAVDANEVSPGTLRIGGFAGGGNAIPKDSQGALVLVRLKVSAASSNNGQQSQICVDHFTDDLSGFQPAPACTTFTLKK
jgi:hypothetical protein